MATILLIDDDPDFVEATCAVLTSVPYHVVVASNGSEGLSRAGEVHPDLIILDLIMPGEDGFQVLAKLQADPRLAPIPVMILTSLINGVRPESAAETEAKIEAYIEKPIRPAELLRRIERSLS
jgi:twitching motility two-component system response regulator PilH